jgi:cytochrome c oxidase subunit 3
MTESRPLVEHQFATLHQQHEAATLGMWLFLATEIMVFGALIGCYLTYRTVYPEAFDATSGHLNVAIGGINTVVLLTSSLTMALSVYAVQVGRRRMLLGCLALTAVLGSAFLALKGVEYYSDYVEGLMPLVSFHRAEWMKDPITLQHVELALAFYYFMTLLHALHLTVGIALILYLMIGVARNAITPAGYMPVEVIGLYWHFVDVVWIFLLPLLYVLGTHKSFW